MSRFGVYMYQTGGCDYTIGCGHLFIELPNSIQSLEEAVEHVMNTDGEGSLNYYGRERIHECVIHEIADSFKVNMFSVQQQALIDHREFEKEKRRQQFESLKKEFQ